MVLDSSGDLEENPDLDLLTALRYASICAVSLLAVTMPLLAQHLKLSMKARILLPGMKRGSRGIPFRLGTKNNFYFVGHCLETFLHSVFLAGLVHT